MRPPTTDGRWVVVETKDLVKIYSGDGVATAALNGVNLKIFQGEFVAIVGPSGCGKSTLLNMIGALDIPTSGKVYIDGIDMTSLGGTTLAELRNKKIGFIFQSFNLIPRMNAIENVELPLSIRGAERDERRSRAKKMLELVGLGSKVLSRPTQLSGGEQQRVAVARALVTDPAIILGDEPTGNLDWETSDSLIDLFKAINKEGKTILMATHHKLIIEKLGNRVIELKGGKMIGDKGRKSNGKKVTAKVKTKDKQKEKAK